MTALQITLLILRNYKSYAALIAAVASGVGMIASKNYDQGLETIFQALLVVLGSAGTVGAVGVGARAAAKVAAREQAKNA